MATPLAEDLLVFGVGADGNASTVTMSGSYEQTEVPPAQQPETRKYEVVFGAGSQYSITDLATGTVVSEGQFDPVSRTLRYGNWNLNLSGIPATGDVFTVQPTQDPLGDNRNAAAFVQLQERPDVMTGQSTFQQSYEALVNRVGSLSVQAEVSKNAQQVMVDHATQARDRVSGVNLDEELADLLRFQQAYQANAQVIQAASKLFDSLMQRL
jgi:flagellar hook-associated protein 1 FlgK